MYKPHENMRNNPNSLTPPKTLTVPYTTVELDPKAHTHNPVSQWVEAHHTGHNGRAQVFEHNIICVLIS